MLKEELSTPSTVIKGLLFNTERKARVALMFRFLHNAGSHRYCKKHCGDQEIAGLHILLKNQRNRNATVTKRNGAHVAVHKAKTAELKEI
jgi:hypothetical protein